MMKQENEAKNSNRSTETKTRGGFGGERPSRRVLEGHTRPCEDCGAVKWNFDITRGEITCEDCGLVVEENVPDPGAEWTNRDNGQDRSRVGRPMTYTLADKGLNTTIDVRDLNTGVATRHGMSSQARRDWRRRRVIDERSKTRKSRERNLVKANQYIRDRSGLPDPLQEEAARLYRRLSSEGFVTGRSIAGVTAACTYLVARQEELPRQIPEIADAFDITEKDLSRLIRQVSRRLNMHKITGPDEYFDKFISDLGLEPSIRGPLEELWGMIEPHDDVWQGKKPMGVAAALIYKASNETDSPRTQSEVCAVANVSEVTLRGLLRLFDDLLEKIAHYKNLE
jgi:transcription initiation factor TFIIB